MAVRKFLANQLTNAAKAVESDRTKERIGAAVFTTRVAIANALMPKQVKAPVKR